MHKLLSKLIFLTLQILEYSTVIKDVRGPSRVTFQGLIGFHLSQQTKQKIRFAQNITLQLRGHKNAAIELRI